MNYPESLLKIMVDADNHFSDGTISPSDFIQLMHVYMEWRSDTQNRPAVSINLEDFESETKN